jgi:hypothetical protein
MAHLNSTGPEEKGAQTGRALGLCTIKASGRLDKLGIGMGLRRKSGGGKGNAQRLKSGEEDILR